MINEFLDIIKDGYTVEFSENNTLGMTEITVGKYGKTASHSINLDHLKEFENFDHSTGYNLPLNDPYAVATARRLLNMKYEKEK